MYGMNIYVVQDRTVKVFAFNLPRTKCRTPAMRKSYNRLRRKGIAVFRDEVVRFEDTHGCDWLQFGNQLHMSPRVYEAMKRELKRVDKQAKSGSLYGYGF